jgi:hypothetical protein
MRLYQIEHKKKLEMLTISHQEKMRIEEMRECSFQPNVGRIGRPESGAP